MGGWVRPTLAAILATLYTVELDPPEVPSCSLHLTALQ